MHKNIKCEMISKLQKQQKKDTHHKSKTSTEICNRATTESRVSASKNEHDISHLTTKRDNTDVSLRQGRRMQEGEARQHSKTAKQQAGSQRCNFSRTGEISEQDLRLPPKKEKEHTAVSRITTGHQLRSACNTQSTKGSGQIKLQKEASEYKSLQKEKKQHTA
jgi:hypothetical protein